LWCQSGDTRSDSPPQTAYTLSAYRHSSGPPRGYPAEITFLSNGFITKLKKRTFLPEI
jgi:hypothetical protein